MCEDTDTADSLRQLPDVAGDQPLVEREPTITESAFRVSDTCAGNSWQWAAFWATGTYVSLAAASERVLPGRACPTV
jgi:hypothetical protein